MDENIFKTLNGTVKITTKYDRPMLEQSAGALD
jgi:hypothetical protein